MKVYQEDEEFSPVHIVLTTKREANVMIDILYSAKVTGDPEGSRLAESIRCALVDISGGGKWS